MQTAEHPIWEQLSNLKNLPSLPHVLLKLLKACDDENCNLLEVARIVGSDPALSSKVLKLVNSVFYGISRRIESIEQAVFFAGIQAVKNLAICSSVLEMFTDVNSKHFNLDRFWWHSLKCAFIARQISEKRRYPHPEEAFMAGLLHDIGKLVLWVNFPDAYDQLLEKCAYQPERMLKEEAQLGATHAEVGAWLLSRWNFSSLLSDSVRYHHAPPNRIVEALPLVQTVYAANLLSRPGDSRPVQPNAAIDGIFHFKKSETAEIISQADEKAADLAHMLEIAITPDLDTAPPEKDPRVTQSLHSELRNLSLLIGTMENLLQADTQNDILKAIAEGLNVLFDIHHYLFYLWDAEKALLRAFQPDVEGNYVESAAMAVPLKAKDCLLVRAFETKAPADGFSRCDDRELTLIDEQLVRYWGKDGLYCFPFSFRNEVVGVLAVGLDRLERKSLIKSGKMLRVFLHKGALALHLMNLRESRLKTIRSERHVASSDLARKIIHEINNPLGIVRNYLRILEIKTEAPDEIDEDIRIITEEIDRIARLLKQLSEFSAKKDDVREDVDVNSILSDIVRLMRGALAEKSNIDFQADLASNLPKVFANRNGLKQVFINLLKNAVEALAGEGRLLVKTQYFRISPTALSGTDGGLPQGYVVVTIQDDGPGISDELKEKIFDPYVSSKGGSHSGLGLSIAYHLIQSFNGAMTCESEPGKGTLFRIDLPASETG